MCRQRRKLVRSSRQQLRRRFRLQGFGFHASGSEIDGPGYLEWDSLQLKRVLLSGFRAEGLSFRV